MPNQPRATVRTRPVKVDDALWARALARCRNEGTTASAVMRAALRAVVAGEPGQKEFTFRIG